MTDTRVRNHLAQLAQTEEEVKRQKKEQKKKRKQQKNKPMEDHLNQVRMLQEQAAQMAAEVQTGDAKEEAPEPSKANGKQDDGESS